MSAETGGVGSPVALPEGVVFSEGDLTIRHQHARPDWMVARLEAAVWGTKGLRYRMHDVATMLHAAPEMTWMVLEADSEPLASLGLVSRRRLWNRRQVDTVYLSLFAVRADRQRQGLGRTLLAETRRFLLDHLPSGLGFALIESENLASLKASAAAGYERASRVHMVNVARSAPRPSDRVHPLRNEQASEFLCGLEETYGTHQLYDGAASVQLEKCWALADRGRILAALQAEPRRTTLVDLGYRGWLERALPWIPVLRRLVTPDDYRYLWVQHIWFAEGQAARAFELLQGVLHATGHRLSTVQWDPDSPVYHRWRRGGWLGPLAPFTQRFEVVLLRNRVEEAEEPYVYALSGV